MATQQPYLNRLRKEYNNIIKDPPPHISARPLPSNILHWYFVISGPQDTPYSGGFYFGKLMFPLEYPYKPPSVYMLTPSGRFKQNTKLCLSMSDFHPESWNPLWSVGSVLTGLLSFMLGNEDTVGSIKSSESVKMELAKKSMSWNQNDKLFRELFPEFVENYRLNSKEKAIPKQEKQNSIRNDEQSESILGLIGWLTALGIVLGLSWILMKHLGSFS
mmetsp:Transcript_6266/g.11170  ORF Transcript_6266/g.11170 Transcript_6266/m.11170 type:complete len:217 (-) Transcript_6266:1420-2070(-)